MQSRTGEGFQQANSIVQSYHLGMSKRLSESIMNSRIQKISAPNDPRIKNQMVKSRIENLYETDASKMRNIYSVDEEMRIEALQARYLG